jgi:hypothetical protein
MWAVNLEIIVNISYNLLFCSCRKSFLSLVMLSAYFDFEDSPLSLSFRKYVFGVRRS